MRWLPSSRTECAPCPYPSVTRAAGCVAAARSGGSVPVLRSVHHDPAVRPHIQLRSDRDAAGERGADGGILHRPAHRAAAPEHRGQTLCYATRCHITICTTSKRKSIYFNLFPSIRPLRGFNPRTLLLLGESTDHCAPLKFDFEKNVKIKKQQFNQHQKH